MEGTHKYNIYTCVHFETLRGKKKTENKKKKEKTNSTLPILKDIIPVGVGRLFPGFKDGICW